MCIRDRFSNMKILELLDFRKENQTFEKPVMWALITFFFLLFGFKSAIGQDKVRFVAGGVTCSMCSNAIHSSLKLDTSISKIHPNLQTQVWSIEYKKNTFKLEELRKKVENSGFSIQKVWLNGEVIYEKKRNRNGNQKK